MRLYEVGPNLFTGAHPRDGSALVRAGITAVVCVSKKPTPPPVVAGVGAYAYVPIRDGKVVDPAVWRAVTVVRELLRLNHRVYVHCLAGRNRAMLVAALIERERRSWSGAIALAHVRAVRPRCLHNEAFAAYLAALWPAESDAERRRRDVAVELDRLERTGHPCRPA